MSYHFGRSLDKKNPLSEVFLSDVNKKIPKGTEHDYAFEIDGEFEKNDFKGNDIKHEKYVLSLVRADYTFLVPKLQKQSYNAGTPIFKILFENAPGMDGNYAAFRKNCIRV